jgi:hypothetical protein
MKRFSKGEASQKRVVKFEVFIFHLFDILSILLPSVLARKTANKSSSYDLAFISDALR